MPLEPGAFDRMSYLAVHVDQAQAVANAAIARGEVGETDFRVIRKSLIKALMWLPETEL